MIKMRVFWKGFVRGLVSPAAIFKFRRYHSSRSAEFLQGFGKTDHIPYYPAEKRHHDAVQPRLRWHF
jgi:hypothetical protein